MKNELANSTRIALFISAAALGVILVVPMWRIDLEAPQYPEGLRLLIYPHKLGGNVDIINGLNHYIGMKTLHTGDFAEFSILPYIIGTFALGLILVALLSKRIALYIALILFISFGILAMVDFWKWEYDYGHHLNPDAAIVVPGMAYQPPLIGYKQLLNFSAFSQPDIGGWIFVAVGTALVFLGVREWFKNRKTKKLPKPAVQLLTLGIVAFSLSSCSSGPEAIVPGKDQCHFCGMTVSDNRFGAEFVTPKGKVYKFDDTHCLLSFLDKNGSPEGTVYITDFCSSHTLIKSDEVLLLKSEKLNSPMAGNIAAFQSKDSLEKIQRIYGGSIFRWADFPRP